MKSFAFFFLALLAAYALISAPSVASDFTLNIFGNANLDGTIDPSDIAYIQSIIEGKAESTELADANNDGKVNSQDLDQVGDIIQGVESELTMLMDTRTSMGSTEITKVPVTIKMPVKSIVSPLLIRFPFSDL